MPGDDGVDLSLVLACYHEEQILDSSVHSLRTVLDATRLRWEIIFVDDASRDRTPELIRRLVAANPALPFRAIYHEHNLGRGRTVADGFRVATGAVVGFVDADLEVAAHYIPPCWQAIAAGADVAVGRRFFKFSLRGVWRYLLSTGYAAVVRRLLPVPGVEDTEAGYKFFRRAVALKLIEQVEDPGWFWDTEIMYRAAQAGYRIAQVPCLYLRNYVKRSTVRSVRDSLRYARQLVRFRARLAREARSPGAPAT